MSDTLDFSGTMSMVKTDNGWQEARQRLARAPDIGAMMIAIIFNLVRFREQSRDLLFLCKHGRTYWEVKVFYSPDKGKS